MPSVKVNINGPSFMKWMIVPYAANYFKINEDDNIQLTSTLQYESHFILNNDNNILVTYDSKFKPSDHIYNKNIDIYEKYNPFSYFTLSPTGNITILYDEDLLYKWYPTEYVVDLSMGGYYYIIISNAVLYDNVESFLLILENDNILYDININAEQWEVLPFYRDHKKIEHSYTSNIITNKSKLQVNIINSNYHWQIKRGKWYFVNEPNILYNHMDVVDLEPGEYEIGFVDVPFWLTPNNMTITIEENKTKVVEAIYLSAEYIQSQITVKINGPDSARWYIQEDKSSFIKHNDILLTTKANIIVPTNKEYIIYFTDVDGYITPEPITCFVTENSNINITVNYEDSIILR